ncbi:hypothetical protein PTSG_03899 [Salpingoeca rosetta]|uniref:Proline-rich protein PRCC n=1 Tax=Salpingoeca rosetta (strain ATCC 50818 / BSB-021) TaxID=946362 RepID=F2U772_SALR5|nr:uncharacterized protein PTSG_03899 [Salpingoeca rosetta]EGD83289.1 hypothetical protein PTSG_03899 [Salpingoeca rosetta]|eukprot:XP_004994793.1 hypothetical protein PTSG_03899 [Salpingoeca rosetta]
MSLVDYGSSSDEDHSEDEEEQRVVGSTAGVKKAAPPRQAAAVDKKKQRLRAALEAKRRQMFNLPDPDASEFQEDDDEDDDAQSRQMAPAPKKPKLFSELLPAPKHSSATPAAKVQRSSITTTTTTTSKPASTGPGASSSSTTSTVAAASSAAASSSSSSTAASSLQPRQLQKKAAGIPATSTSKHTATAARPANRFGLVADDDDGDDDGDDDDDGEGGVSGARASSFSASVRRQTQYRIASTSVTAAPVSGLPPPPSYDMHSQYQSAPVPKGKPKFGYGRAPQVVTSQQQQQQQYQEQQSAHGTTSKLVVTEEDEELKRFLGRREGHGAIKLVNVDDRERRDTFDEWRAKTKNSTDTTPKSSLEADVPKGMERRKHQITYLAAEARAREQELQTKWAHSAAARRAARQRYGF